MTIKEIKKENKNEDILLKEYFYNFNVCKAVKIIYHYADLMMKKL